VSFHLVLRRASTHRREKKKKKERDKAHLQANGHVRTKGKSLHGKVETVLLCLEL